MVMYISKSVIQTCVDNHIKVIYKGNIVNPENYSSMGMSDILSGYIIYFEAEQGYSFTKSPFFGFTSSPNSMTGCTTVIENKKYSFNTFKNNDGINRMTPNIVSGEIIKPCYKFTKTDTDRLQKNKLKLFINGVFKPYFIQSGGVPYEAMPNDLIEIKTDESYLYINSFKLDNDNFNIIDNVASLVLPEKVYTTFNFNFTYRPPRLTLNQDDYNKLTENKAILKLNDIAMNVGDIAFDGDILTIETIGNYEFLEAPYFDIVKGLYHSGTYSFLLDSKTKANLHINGFNINDIDDRELKYISIFTNQKDESKGLNNLFKIDTDQMRMLNVERFQPINIEGGTTDFGVNIIGLINLPFEVEADKLLEPENIIMGTLQTQVIAPKLKSDRYIYNFGEIEVNEGLNSLDYENTKAVLYLPFTDPMILSLDMVLGHKIQIQYVIDLYSGQSDVNVLSSKNNAVFATKNVNLGIKIPHGGENGEQQFAENINIVMGGDNFIRKPFIEIHRNEAILSDGIFTNTVNDEKTLLGESGFLEIEQIKLESNATSEEKRLIVTALKNGVIIN